MSPILFKSSSDIENLRFYYLSSLPYRIIMENGSITGTVLDTPYEIFIKHNCTIEEALSEDEERIPVNSNIIIRIGPKLSISKRESTILSEKKDLEKISIIFSRKYIFNAIITQFGTALYHATKRKGISVIGFESFYFNANDEVWAISDKDLSEEELLGSLIKSKTSNIYAFSSKTDFYFEEEIRKELIQGEIDEGIELFDELQFQAACSYTDNDNYMAIVFLAMAIERATYLLSYKLLTKMKYNDLSSRLGLYNVLLLFADLFDFDDNTRLILKKVQNFLERRNKLLHVKVKYNTETQTEETHLLSLYTYDLTSDLIVVEKYLEIVREKLKEEEN